MNDSQELEPQQENVKQKEKPSAQEAMAKFNAKIKEGQTPAASALRQFLNRESTKAEFARAIPAALTQHYTPDRMVRVCLTAISQNRDLANCEPASFASALLQAAQLGLEPDGLLGQAYLVPYKTKVKLIIGYRGQLALAYRSERVVDVKEDLVYSEDYFEFENGTEPFVKHKRKLGNRGEFIGAWAVANLINGGKIIEIMDADDIEALRNRSAAKDSGPWVTDRDEMRRKCILRRISKKLPLDAISLKQIMHEEYAEAGVETKEKDGE